LWLAVKAGAVEARTLIAAAELMPVLNASDAASEGFAAACLLPKIRAQRLRSARGHFSPLCFAVIVAVIFGIVIVFRRIRVVTVIFSVIITLVVFRVIFAFIVLGIIFAHPLPRDGLSLFGFFVFFLFGSSRATANEVSKTKCLFLRHFRLLFFQVSF
jgi:ABC-type Na+ efflux pump permease subunit